MNAMTSYEDQSYAFLRNEKVTLHNQLLITLVRAGQEALTAQGWAVQVPKATELFAENDRGTAFQQAWLSFGPEGDEPLPYWIGVVLLFENQEIAMRVNLVTPGEAWHTDVEPTKSVELFRKPFFWKSWGDAYEHWSSWMAEQGYTGTILLDKTKEFCNQVSTDLEP